MTKPHMQIIRAERTGSGHHEPYDGTNFGYIIGMQDANCVAEYSDGIVVAVCDGCSDGSNAVVGARILSGIAAKLFALELDKVNSLSKLNVEKVRLAIIREFREVVVRMYPDYHNIRYNEYKYPWHETVMATLVIMLTKNDEYEFLHVGDGYFIADGKVVSCRKVYEKEIGDKGLPYLGYELTNYKMVGERSGTNLLEFNSLKRGTLVKGQLHAVASDGLEFFLKDKKDKEELLQVLSQTRSMPKSLSDFLEDKMGGFKAGADAYKDDVTIVTVNVM